MARTESGPAFTWRREQLWLSCQLVQGAMAQRSECLPVPLGLSVWTDRQCPVWSDSSESMSVCPAGENTVKTEGFTLGISPLLPLRQETPCQWYWYWKLILSNRAKIIITTLIILSYAGLTEVSAAAGGFARLSCRHPCGEHGWIVKTLIFHLAPSSNQSLSPNPLLKQIKKN